MSPRSMTTRRIPFIRWIVGLIAVLSLLPLVGCATVGHSFPYDRVQEIHIGQTTKGQLLSMFGLPYRRGIEDGDSTWTYVHYKFRLFGEHMKTRDLYVRFSEDGRVASYTYNSNMDS